MRFRQVHLDFHTSEAIAGVGADFDADRFAATLERARVDSITCFARCHHGWMYYDTKLFPERLHPGLVRPGLLAEQIDACHRRDIRVPIYVTVQWDHYTAERHPEWSMLEHDGRIRGSAPYEPGFYRSLCVNTGYRDFLKSHVRELLETLPVDGFFFDIVTVQECSCRQCKAGMLAGGLDPAVAEGRRRYAEELMSQFKHDMTAFVRQFSSDCTIFYNAGHLGPALREAADAYTHFELESLPSGSWGYVHFPLVVRYTRNLGRPCLGMTGKFHTAWGDFHSFKNRAALEFECFRALALNAACSVGDQLHPRGRLCPHTYELIGSVYREVERKEPWCRQAEALCDIGVMTPEEFGGADLARMPAPAVGAVRMLEEEAQQFDVIDSNSDLARYRVVIMPDEISVSRKLARRIEEYLAGGGAVIASHRAGLDPAGKRFALKALGVRLVGEAPFSPDFLLPGAALGAGLPATEHVMYLKGLEVKAARGSEVLAEVVAPYFNRTWEHFCSHRHTPSAGKAAYPGVVRSGAAIYFAHPIFTQYHNNAPRWCRLLLSNALAMLLPEPLVRIEAPTTTLATLNRQAAEKRWVLHLLHYVPVRRGADFDVVEDVIPLFDVKVSVRSPGRVKAARLVPDGRDLELRRRRGRAEFTVPEVRGHQMVELRL